MQANHAVVAVATAAPPRQRHDLQGLLGIAVVLAVISHVWFDRLSAGVDVMLVLAGFVVGDRLLGLTSDREISARAGVAWLARRLLPALVVVVAAGAALTLVVQPRTRWETFADHALSTLGFIQNWQLAHSAGDYAPAGEAITPLQHLWAVSVLAQVVVALVVVGWVVGLVVPQRLRRRVVVAAVLTAMVGSFLYAVAMHDADQGGAFYDTAARAWEVLAGVAVAALLSGGLTLHRRGRTCAAVVGLAGILVAAVFVDGAQEFPGPLALLPVGATILLICSAPGAPRALPGPNRLLALMPVAALGSMAYALYLWHWPLLIFWLARTDDEDAGLSAGLAVVAVSVALAYATTRWVERPLRHAPIGGLRLPAVALGTALVVLAAVVAAGSVAWRQHVTAVRAAGGELRTLSPVDYPGARALVEQRKVAKLPIRPTVLEASEDLPVTIADGCISDFANTTIIKCAHGDPTAPRTIALVGGSHSEHWLTALDELGRWHGFAVVTYLKMGCPLTTDEVPRVSVSNDPYPGCREWTDATLASLLVDRPDYVFTTTTRPHPDVPGDFVPDNYLGIWDVFAFNALPVLGVRDTPWMYRDGMLFSPVDCLAEGGDADTCGLPRTEALADYNPTMDYLDRYPGIVPLDLSDAVCGPAYCRAAEGNVLVYHDGHHLTSSYVRTLSDELGRQLSAATGWW